MGSKGSWWPLLEELCGASPAWSDSTVTAARLKMMIPCFRSTRCDYAISSPRIVPFDVENVSASMPSRWSMET